MPPTLALHFGALGDFVISWPALGRLAAAAGPAGLHLIGQPAWGRLVLPAGQVLDRESARFAPLFRPDPHPSLDAWLAGFGRAAVFARRPDPVLLARLAAHIPQVWAIPTRPAPDQARPAGQVQADALAAHGLPPAPPLGLRLPPPITLGPPVIAPGSGGRAKRLAPELTAGLARRLAGQGRPPLIVLGPAEDRAFRGDLARALAAAPAGHSSLADPPLTDLAAALRAAPLYIGADSGVSHLAAAAGARCLVAFGPSDPAIWAPPGARVRICGFADLAALAAGGEWPRGFGSA
ncbi:MAG: glycosyltransferase family 9 protein [Pseudomonadota bacterium]